MGAPENTPWALYALWAVATIVVLGGVTLLMLCWFR